MNFKSKNNLSMIFITIHYLSMKCIFKKLGRHISNIHVNSLFLDSTSSQKYIYKTIIFLNIQNKIFFKNNKLYSRGQLLRTPG